MELSNFDEEIVELSRQDWDRYWVETYSELNYTKAMENGLKCMIYEIHETDNDGNEVVWGADMYDNALTALITVTAVLTGVSAAGYIATKVLLKKKEDTTEVKDEG